MGVWNIILLLFNIVLIFIISVKVSNMGELTNQQETIRDSMEKLVHENSQIANLVIDQLESKLIEARAAIEQLDERTGKSAETIKIPAGSGRESMQFNEESYYSLMGPSNSKIIYMKQLGMSVQEIAERLHMSQGEIDLKINLQEKQNPTQLERRKSR